MTALVPAVVSSEFPFEGFNLTVPEIVLSISPAASAVPPIFTAVIGVWSDLICLTTDEEVRDRIARSAGWKKTRNVVDRLTAELCRPLDVLLRKIPAKVKSKRTGY